MRKNSSKKWSFESLEGRTLLAAPTLIDVMVVYDANAKTKLNVNDVAIQKLIRQSIDSANQAHYNTGDNIVLRLVYTGQVNDNPTGTLSGDLANLDSGLIPNVNTLRTQYGADLVSLITTASGSSAGLANALLNPNGDPTEAFSVIDANSIGPGNFTIAHETGHNLGAGHERDNFQDPTPNPIFPYAFGYHFTAGPSSNTYGDIMSYQGLTLPYFSNPNITYQGQPLGQPAGTLNAADLYSTFLLTAPKVAAYKAAVATDTTAPVATLYQSDLAGNQLTFQVRYQDDVSVNASTLGDGDVYVHTPEGFNLQAQFLSLDRAGDGYAKVATYRVTLPNSKPPLSSLTFFLNANQVKDINSNTTAAGQIVANTDFDIDKFSFQAARDTGTLAAPQTRQISGNISTGDTQDLYKFTVTQHSAFNVTLTGLSSSAEIFLEQDLNGNDTPDFGPETIDGTNQSGNVDRSISANLDPGVYYVLVQLNNNQPPTNYTLTVRNYVDVVPPTATLDAVDTNAATTGLTFSVLFSDDQGLDFQSVEFDGLISFSLIYSGGSASGHTGSPNSTILLPNGQVVATYTVNFGQNLPNGTVTASIYSGAQVTDSAGNPLPTGTVIGTYKLAGSPLTVDNTAPTRALSSAPQVLVPGGTSYSFVVAYHDNRGILASTLDDNDIVVAGPRSSQAAHFVSSTVSPGGSFTYATYSITPPGGAWDWSDDGNYNIILQPNQVTDAQGNAAGPTGQNNLIGSIIVHVPFPGDADGDNATSFSDLVAVAQNYGTAGKGQASGDFDYDGVVGFSDLVLVAQNYGRNLANSLPSSAVPAMPVVVAASKPAPLAKPQPVSKPVAAFSTTSIKSKNKDLLS